MTIIVLTDCPPRLRGDLTKWLLEINTGVYVGNMNPRVRDKLWNRVCEHVKNGRATMVYSANNEQRMEFRVHNTTWEPIDFDGLTLMRRPLPHTRETLAVSPSPLLKDGFSNAAHQQRSRQMAKRKPIPTTYAVIDVETTGLNPLDDYIIEIAALLVEEGKSIREFHRLIRSEQPIPPDIIRLTGISNDDLRTQGQSLHQVVSEMQDFIGDAPLVSHNAAFDQQFLVVACRKAGTPPLRNRFIDTLASARRKISSVPNYKLQTLAVHLGIRVQHPHRALADCYTTNQLFIKLNER